MIPYARQKIGQRDINKVVSVLKSDFLTQGPMVSKFEDSIKRYCGASHAIAVNSATSALHIACRSLALKNGDYLWTSVNTFVASANCGLYCDAKVDLVDIDPNSLNMCVKDLHRKLLCASKKNKLPKVVVVVHFAGRPADMKKIFELSKKFGFKIIEDASHAIGSSFNDFKTGSCKYSDITIFSFHPVKIITTGEGGVAVTNDQSLAKNMDILRSHGITRDKRLLEQNDGPWYYEQVQLGFNYRLTDLQAALGLEQTKNIDVFVKKRKEMVNHYNSTLRDLPLKLPLEEKHELSSWHLYVIWLDQKKTVYDRKELFNYMRKKGILVNVHYIPLYRQPHLKKFNFNQNLYPNMENYYRGALTLPLFPSLKRKDQNFVIQTLKNYLS